ncbi:asparaginyl-tRNA synthetase [Candidatus Photodesmus blepharus]|uniref:Asparagine--tRNA ligase n=1 Tax=Candidatus Photodesmus blepharonis TaxID=1179155 RepID=A0A084CPA3_9GAMM|nr:asparagine--tRNA ligase [Candidatus Photodesmus blepharus]KEY91632.1 asparaginyl-tRNA synthetase [Candidatus Photodesmus blepharus]
MTYTPIKNVLHEKIAIDTQVTIRGWVRSRRDSKAGISFLCIYDGSCFDSIQSIIPNNLNNYKNEILKLTTGCSVEVTGKIVKSPSQGQKIELAVITLKVIGWIENAQTYPISKTRHSIEYLREVAHLRPRTNIIGAITRIRHCLSQSIHRFYHEQGYFWVSTPLITTVDTEGSGEMFRVSTLDITNLPRTKQGKINYNEDFFGKETFLTVSGQLNAEAYACALSKVYTFGPTFRAENSNTSRHLAEFWMVEPEVAFAGLQDISKLSETMLKYVFKAVLEENYDDLSFLTQNINKKIIPRLEKMLESNFLHVSYTDAIQILLASEKKFEFDVKWGIDMSSEHERYLVEEYFKAPVIVENYPKKVKAFYMRLNDDAQTVASMDVLMPGIGEIIGGSQREERLEILDARMMEMAIEPNKMNWYRDLRRYGTVPHAGFGLGFERLVSYVTGMSNLRDVIPFPRTPGSANF